MEFRCLLPRSQELATCPCRKPDESTQRHPISLRFGLMLSANLRLGLPSSLLPSRVPTKILRAFLFSSLQVTSPALVNTLRTGDADLRLYITTVQDG